MFVHLKKTLIFVAIALMLAGCSSGPSEFAQCLSSNGAVMYGAWWCPHCERQLEIIGSDRENPPYVECSNRDRSQNALCTEAGVKSYPTWVFPDGSRLTGAYERPALAEKTGCDADG